MLPKEKQENTDDVTLYVTKYELYEELGKRDELRKGKSK